MKVLVTGGAGFIGSHVVLELLKGGDDVVACDIQITQNALDQILGEQDRRRLKLERVDIAQAASLAKMIRTHNVEVIAHIASPLSAMTEQDPELAIRNMIQMQHAVLEAAYAANLRKVVWASSSGVFGGVDKYPVVPLPNGAPHYPTNLYGACKSFNEYLAAHYTLRFGLDTLGLRFPAVYGLARLRGATYFRDLVEKPALGQACRLPMGDAVYNWLYVADAALLVSRGLHVERTSTRNFNVGSEVASMRHAVAMIREWLPDAVIELEPGSYGVIAEYDCTALREEVGFVPQWSLRRALLHCINAVRARAGLPLVGGAVAVQP